MFNLRVISGKARGIKLVAPCGMDTRPTLDRVKESLFSVICPYIDDSYVLDLFAGSGALGLEAISRYAARCVFVDNSSKSIQAVKSNLNKTHMIDKSDVILGDSVEFLKTTTQKFDIIFIDPPYESGLYETVLSIIKDRSLLNRGGIITIECDRNQDIDVFGFSILKNKVYGSVRIYILEDFESK